MPKFYFHLLKTIARTLLFLHSERCRFECGSMIRRLKIPWALIKLSFHCGWYPLLETNTLVACGMLEGQLDMFANQDPVEYHRMFIDPRSRTTLDLIARSSRTTIVLLRILLLHNR